MLHSLPASKRLSRVQLYLSTFSPPSPQSNELSGSFDVYLMLCTAAQTISSTLLVAISLYSSWPVSRYHASDSVPAVMHHLPVPARRHFSNLAMTTVTLSPSPATRSHSSKLPSYTHGHPT